MTRQFFLGFFSCMGLLCLVSATQVSQDYEPKLQAEIKNIYDGLSHTQLAVVSSTPSYTSLRQGESVIYHNQDYKALITRIGNANYKLVYSPI